MLHRINREFKSFTPNQYDRSYNVDSILQFAVASETFNQNRSAVLLSYFHPQLATIDYVSIGDVYMMHISEISSSSIKYRREQEER